MNKSRLDFKQNMNEIDENNIIEPDYYRIDNKLAADIGVILLSLKEDFEKKNVYRGFIKKTFDKYFDDITDQDISETIRKEFSIKDKIKYFSKRVNDNRLSKAQRNYAENRIKYLTNLKKY